MLAGFEGAGTALAIMVAAIFTMLHGLGKRRGQIQPSVSLPAESEAPLPAPTGMHLARKSTSLPNLLRRMRAHKTRLDLPTHWENYTTDACVLATVRCLLTTAEREQGVKVTVQCLKDARTTYIRILRHHKCILYLDRHLLLFVENADRRTLAFNAHSHEYDWWVLVFERRRLHDYHALHYHILQDASL